MSLKFHLFVSDVNQENEDFEHKKGGFKIFLRNPTDGKIIPRSSTSC